MLELFGIIILLGVMWWGAFALIRAFGLGEPVRTILVVALAVISLIVLADAFAIPIPFLHRLPR